MLIPPFFGLSLGLPILQDDHGLIRNDLGVGGGRDDVSDQNAPSSDLVGEFQGW